MLRWRLRAKSLSEMSLKVVDLLRELKDIESKWDRFGIHLGLSQNEIRVIERDCVDCENGAVKMYDKWLRKEENPSWRKIIAALEHMSESNLASQLRKKYLQHEEPAMTTHTSEEMTDKQATEKVLKVDRQDIIARELEGLKEKYLKLVMSTESALETANPSPRQLKRFSQSYIKDLIVTTVEELFDRLGEFCFLDYTLLENTISIFLKESQPVVSDLSDYIQQLTNFKKSTTIKEFKETIESLTTIPVEGTKLCTVTLRLVGGWLEKTMEDLEKLLKEIFQDKSSILAHLKIIRGSVVVIYFAPQSEADSLVELAKTKVLFMVQVGVLKVQIEQLLIPVNTINKFSFEYSLIKAVVDNEVNLVTFLLDINTSPDATDPNGHTALMHGSYYNQDKTVSILLKAKANPNLQTNSGVTALFMAAQEGHSHVVTILLKAKADPNLHRKDGFSPLHMGAFMGYIAIVNVLLDANANPNLQLVDGTTPLFMAAQNGYLDVVKNLLIANADPNLKNYKDISPIFMASQFGHTDIVRILLQAKANPDLQRDDGASPLYIAAFMGYTFIVGILLANANPNVQSVDRTTPLYMAAQNGRPDIVYMLLVANANPNLSNDVGVTPIFMASMFGYTDTVSILLHANANPNLRRDDGTTPIFMASQFGYIDTVNILLKFKANPNLQKDSSDGSTPLYIAAQAGHSDIVEILLKANANPNLQNKQGATPLCIASQEGHSDIVRILLNANANPNIQTRDYYITPLMSS